MVWPTTNKKTSRGFTGSDKEKKGEEIVVANIEIILYCSVWRGEVAGDHCRYYRKRAREPKACIMLDVGQTIGLLSHCD